MRSSFASRSGFVLSKTPSYRQQAARRRLGAVGAVVGLALVSGLIGSLTSHSSGEAPRGAHTGPFSYFPSE